MGFTGWTFLITGASQGIGRVLAVHFARRGARVILAARSEEGLSETATMIRDGGGQCAWFACDLRDRDSIKNLASRLTAGESVRVLINNAADVTSKRFLDTSIEEIESLIRTNVTGPLELTRLLAPGMIERGDGIVINVSSLAGYKANPRQTVYSVSKTAVNGMSRALEAEFRDTPIHVMNVALSSVGEQPNQVPPDRYARRLERAIARGEREVFLSLSTKWLMRVYGMLPWLARLR